VPGNGNLTSRSNSAAERPSPSRALDRQWQPTAAGQFPATVRLVKGNGHSTKGLSHYVVVNAKVFLDSADAPQEVIDFFPRNPQGLPLRF